MSTSTQRLLAVTTALVVTSSLFGAPVKREPNDNREKLTAMETKPFDRAAIADLTDWTHADVLAESNTKGSVVVLAVLSASDPASIMSLTKLTRMHRDYAQQGLTVVAIHPDFGYDKMYSMIQSGRVTIPVARDANNTFVTAMHTDDYPDLYVIDRAGNLRYADIDKNALKNAITNLINETPETAATNAALQAQGLEPKATALSQETTSPQSPKSSGQSQPKPNSTADRVRSSAKKSTANWPSQSTKTLATKNSQGQKLPQRIGLDEEWLTEEQSLEGKVLIIDFWASHSSPGKKATKIYNQLLEDYPDQLQVVGISGSEDKDKVLRYLSNGKRPYPQLHDDNQTLYNALGIKSVPATVILSTDGIIRWQGFALERGFKETVEQIIAADPGV